VLNRIEAVRGDQPPPNEDPSWTTDVPSLSVEELAAQIASGSGVQVVDAAAAEPHVAQHGSDGGRDLA
jgi:hypothetical protein